MEETYKTCRLYCHRNLLYIPNKRGAMLAHRDVIYARAGYDEKEYLRCGPDVRDRRLDCGRPHCRRRPDCAQPGQAERIPNREEYAEGGYRLY
ncbi:MAG: hypothetical protein WAL98_12375 [Desulfatiglandaceae bacterium]